MSIILDLIIVFTILLFIIMSARKGFVRTLIEVVGFVAAIAVALSISTPVSDFIYEKTVTTIMSKFSILNSILDFLPTQEVYQLLLPIGLALGVGIGFVGSFITVKKHLHV